MIDGDLVHIGCYTKAGGGSGEGITLARRDGRNGSLTNLGTVAVTESPSFLAYHPRLPVLYAVNEVEEGMVGAWSVASDGRLSPLGQRSTGGADPCHLAVAPDGRHLACANYGSGSVVVHSLDLDGALGERRDLVAHDGPGLPGRDPERQAGPHAHMVSWLDADRLSVVDLGLDAVFRYALEGGRLRSVGDPLCAPPGTGPRHLARGTAGWWYVAGELDGSVAAYQVDGSGRVRERARESATVHGAPVQPSEIAVGPDGRYLYLANRGPDSIAVFALDAGAPRHVAEVPCGGTWPRHFLICEDFLYVANERSHTVVTFRVSPATGVPAPTGAVMEVASPTCVASPRAW